MTWPFLNICGQVSLLSYPTYCGRPRINAMYGRKFWCILWATYDVIFSNTTGAKCPLRPPMAISNACLGLIKQQSKLVDNSSFLCNIIGIRSLLTNILQKPWSHDYYIPWTTDYHSFAQTFLRTPLRPRLMTIDRPSAALAGLKSRHYSHKCVTRTMGLK